LAGVTGLASTRFLIAFAEGAHLLARHRGDFHPLQQIRQGKPDPGDVDG
jgi:hypothetical protein